MKEVLAPMYSEKGLLQKTQEKDVVTTSLMGWFLKQCCCSVGEH